MQPLCHDMPTTELGTLGVGVSEIELPHAQLIPRTLSTVLASELLSIILIFRSLVTAAVVSGFLTGRRMLALLLESGSCDRGIAFP